MLKVRVMPCLTIKNKRLVKSVQFDEHRNIGSYVAAARVFNGRDVDEMVVLDLDAREQGIDPLILQEITKECFMPLAVGGGVKTLEDVQRLLDLGADKVVMNSGALARPELIREAAARFGAQCVVVSIDAKRVGEIWEVFAEGGKRATGFDAVVWAKQAEALGAGEIFLTSIDQDGVMEGYDTGLIEAISQAVRIPVIASGGAGKPEHALAAVRAGASAVCAASVFQYTQVTPANFKELLAKNGVDTRVSN
ncbi:imidazole glycerol phosphate synthase subunit HisF [Candidatus Uhrbacteria bacterium]|nr:imidazole glycerol phosphate synthase subunit HisF [Candidatus Uhrbacteria bacterium]